MPSRWDDYSMVPRRRLWVESCITWRKPRFVRGSLDMGEHRLMTGPLLRISHSLKHTTPWLRRGLGIRYDHRQAQLAKTTLPSRRGTPPEYFGGVCPCMYSTWSTYDSKERHPSQNIPFCGAGDERDRLYPGSIFTNGDFVKPTIPHHTLLGDSPAYSGSSKRV